MVVEPLLSRSFHAGARSPTGARGDRIPLIIRQVVGSNPTRPTITRVLTCEKG